MHGRVLSAAVAGMLAAGVLAGCGSSSSSASNGGSGSGAGNALASASADAIASATTNAIDSASTAHVAGVVTTNGLRLNVDLHLVSGKGGEGQMTSNGLTVQMVSVGDEVYLKGDTAFWTHYLGSGGAQLLGDRWLKARATGYFASLAGLTDMRTLFNEILGNHGTLVKGATSTVNGQPVVAVTDSTRGGTAYVATAGTPYPLEITSTGSIGGQLYLSDFNAPVSLVAPGNAIDLSQLMPPSSSSSSSG